MKTAPTFVSLLLLFAPAPGGSQDFRTFQPAAVVLGQPTFTSTEVTPVGPFTMNLPTGVAVSPATGKVFAAELNRNRILRFSSAAAMLSGSSAERVIGQVNFTNTGENQGGATGQSTLAWPRRIFVDSLDRLWVADQHNHRVLRFDNASGIAVNGANASAVYGQTNFTNNTAATSASRLDNPSGVYVDGSGDLWVADSGNTRVLRFDLPSTTADKVFGQPDFTTDVAGVGPAALSYPNSLTGDAEGNLWVADSGNHRVLRFANASAAPATGALPVAVLGQSDFTSTATGDGASRMSFPGGVVVTSAGRLFVADGGGDNRRVLWFDEAALLDNGAAASGLLGHPTFTNSILGISDRVFGTPSGLALDGEGRLWVADGSAHRVLRFDPQIDSPPTIRIPGPRRVGHEGMKRKLKGTAGDDWTLARVEVSVNKGKFKRARGTIRWRFKARLEPGRNLVLARSIDDSAQRSRPARLVVIRR